MELTIKQMLMSAVEIRTKIDGLLDIVQKQDESLLKAVYALLGTYVQNREIIGYRTDTHTPVYKNELVAELDATVARVKAGDFITLEELEAEAENW